ncbi:sensor histidine kinase [Microterricola viridarii]|uniref:Two-component system, NarL family, sensor histidine kinase DesK n=1 Tax=Microterricola viridarii TaxID=412690 RepID=A0A1H1NC65_9MICO|nr:histidine kinase [Microterricola viridarii]SDR96480.1 two-component system, NarL family, sensor histidine kinase DesK [Microterricola viridarii]
MTATPTPVRSVQTTWLFTLGSMVFFTVFLYACVAMILLADFAATGGALDAVLLVLCLAAAAVNVRYCWFLRVGRGGGMPRTAWTLALLAPAAFVWVIALFSSNAALLGAIPLWMALCLIACLLPKRPRWLLLTGGVGLIAVHPFLSDAITGSTVDFTDRYSAWLLAVYVVALPVMLLSSLWWWEIVVMLDRNRHTAAELAVARERLRFAADLHDIQGHHLQVIALKSELAERLLTVDAEAARVHVHETRMIAKQALEETRSLVAGYREVALDDELQNAREVLTAAGATCTLDVDPLPAGTDLRRALAMTVREATTNILRHSEAGRVGIRFRSTAEAYTLEIGNDGVGAVSSPGTSGSGLAGLRERLLPVGGELETSFDPDAGQFTLTVCVPTRVGARA